MVLSTGLQTPGTVEDISKKFDIKLNHHGFCWTSPFRPIESNKKGIFVCGPFTEPKDIPETVMQASGAAAGALSILSDVRGSLIQPKAFPPEKDISGQDPLIGVFVCHCGTNIAGVINVPEVVEYAQTLPDVVYAENNLYTCSNDTQDKIKDMINEYGINRVVVASCTPRTHEPMFRNTIHEAGLNPYLFEMANIRDQCSWTHMNEPEKATIKAKDLVRMAVAKARLIEPLYSTSITIKSGALVIGGGIAGMTASLSLAEQGFEVNLVEKEKELGGNMRHIHYLLGGEDPRKELDEIIRKAESHPNIKVWKNASIESIDGFVGNFTTTITQNKKNIVVEHGAVIVASGASEYTPTEYMYDSTSAVLTQSELEEKLAKGKIKAKNIVMIQCVGSREEGHMYCSRVCCNTAVKNALKIKELNPETEIYILYRDMRTYGFNEKYFQEAREKGVIFIRHDIENKPEFTINGDMQIKIDEPLLAKKLILRPDLLVLSSRIDANTDNENIAKMLKIPLNQDGFFLEAHMKLRPVDFATEGVFLAGLAHAPKNITETIAQAEAVAGRAATIISKDEINLSATLSEVVDANCDGCAYCIDPCPYNALTLIEFMRNGAIKKTVEQNEALCKGCGVCMATCPKLGIFVRNFKIEQLQSMIDACLEPVF